MRHSTVSLSHSLFLLLAFVGVLPSASRAQEPTAGSAGTQLIRTRPEAQADFAQVDRAEARGEHQLAVDRLLLMLAADKGLYHATGPGLFVPAELHIQRRIAALKPETQQFYRQRVDPEAQVLLIKAQDGDDAALARLVTEFPHSSHGPAGLELAAARAHDAGEFARAARLLSRRLSEHAVEPATRPVLLGRLVLELELAGRPAEAAEQLAVLRRESPTAAMIFGGRRLVATGVLEQRLRAAEPSLAPDPRRVPADVGAVCRPVWTYDFYPPRRVGSGSLYPLSEVVGSGTESTSQSRRRFRFGPQVDQAVGAEPTEMDWPKQEHPTLTAAGELLLARNSRQLVALDPRSGRVIWSVDAPLFRPLPPNFNQDYYGPMLRPGTDSENDYGRCTLCVVGDRVHSLEAFSPRANQPIMVWAHEGRSGTLTLGNRLTARSLRDGSVIWELGLSEKLARSPDYPTADFGPGDAPGEPVPPKPQPEMLDPAKKAEPARKLPWSGRLIVPAKEWQELLTTGAFQTAPTHANGRLFVIVEDAKQLSAVCLDAGSGMPLWVRTLSDRPRGQGESNAVTPLRGSAPAVVGGTAFFLTNAGILAALDTESGEPIWLADYRGLVGKSAGDDVEKFRARFGNNIAATSNLGPANAPLILDGSVYVLPSDSDRLLAFNAETGKPIWDKPPARGDSDYLLGCVDGKIVLAAGTGALLIDRADGSLKQELGRCATVKDIPEFESATPGAAGQGLGPLMVQQERTRFVHLLTPLAEHTGPGRPALTQSAVYLPIQRLDGTRGVVRISLEPDREPDGRAIRDLPAHASVGPDFGLGSLTVIAGRLYSVAEGQISLLADRETELTRLNGSLAADGPNVSLLLERAELLAAAGRVPAALADLSAVTEVAWQEGLPDLATDADRRRFDLLLCEADRLARSGDAKPATQARRRALLEQANAATGSRERRALVTLELARLEAEQGTPTSLVSAADRLHELLSEPDVCIDSFDPTDRYRQSQLSRLVPLSARRVALARLRELITAHGHGIYAKHNQAANRELDRLIAEPAERAAETAAALERLRVAHPLMERGDRLHLELGRAYARMAAGLQAELDKSTAVLVADQRKKIEVLMQSANRSLELIVNEPSWAESPWRASALAGLASLSVQPPWQIKPRGRLYLNQLTALPESAANESVSWPDASVRPRSEVIAELKRKVGSRAR